MVRAGTFIRALLVAIVLVSVIVACGERTTATTTTANETVSTAASDTSATTLIPAETSTSDATAPGSPGGKALIPSATIGTTVDVLLNDGHIAVQTTSIPVGPAVFTVVNGGNEQHSLTVEGNGGSQTLPTPLEKNVRNTLPVELKEGTYTLFCPILDHKAKGETVTLTIPAK